MSRFFVDPHRRHSHRHRDGRPRPGLDDGPTDRAVPLDHPAQIQILTSHTGADAVTIEQSVATPLEQQMNGVDKMLYVASTNPNDGTMTLVVTFDVESEVDIDQVNARNRDSQAAPNLPADVNQFGLTYRSTVGLPLVVIALYSPRDTYDSLFLGNCALISINDALYRATLRRRRCLPPGLPSGRPSSSWPPPTPASVSPRPASFRR